MIARKIITFKLCPKRIPFILVFYSRFSLIAIAINHELIEKSLQSNNFSFGIDWRTSVPLSRNRNSRLMSSRPPPPPLPLPLLSSSPSSFSLA